MKHLILLLCLFFIRVSAQELSLTQANALAALPLKCLEKEFPNKLNQILQDSSNLLTPKKLHPVFYGCFDWHSAVHGHWSLIYLLKTFPDLGQKENIIQMLDSRFTPELIADEMAYFEQKHEKAFERTYGWAWLLQLQLELDTFNDLKAQRWAENLRPLTNLIISRYLDFLPKLVYPVRAGTHNNTAFGLNFAYDYAVYHQNEILLGTIKKEALRWYANDKNCPFEWEPSGTDFLSPCLEEIGLMHRLLSAPDFMIWAQEFMPQLFELNFDWQVAKVSDRTDGHLVHLDGLNFSRAWHFFILAKAFPNVLGHLEPLAKVHLQFSLPTIFDGHYEGEHWLASFALYAFLSQKTNN
jgi:hypothetical protein